jgi:hypothetical protein
MKRVAATARLMHLPKLFNSSYDMLAISTARINLAALDILPSLQYSSISCK